MSHSSRRDEWKRHTGMVKMLGPKLRELDLHSQRKPGCGITQLWTYLFYHHCKCSFHRNSKIYDPVVMACARARNVDRKFQYFDIKFDLGTHRK